MSNITSGQESLVLNNMNLMNNYQQEHSFFGDLFSFYYQVRGGAPWDYKQIDDAPCGNVVDPEIKVRTQNTNIWND